MVPGLARRGANGVGHCVRVALVLLLGVTLTVGLAAGAVAWRLGQGPLDITGALRWIMAHRPGGGPPVSFGHATIAWAGFAQGSARMLHLDLQDLVVSPPDQPQATIQHAVTDIPVAPLLHGQAVPRTLLLRGVRATIGLGSPSPTEHPADLASLHELDSVVIEDADLTLTGTPAGTARVVGEAHFTRAGATGFQGTSRAHLTLGAAQADASVTASLDDGGTQLEVRLTPVDMTALAAAAPGVTGLEMLQAPLAGHLVLDLAPDLKPRSATAEAEAGPGRAVVQGVAMPFESAALAGSASWTAGSLIPAQADLSKAVVTIRSPSGAKPSTAALTAHLTRPGDALHIEGTATLDRLSLADLGPLWPEKFGGHARPWLVENITAGTVRQGRASYVIEAGADGAHPKLTGLTAALAGDDVTIHWLRPVPPVEHVQAALSMKTPDVLEINASTGRQGAGRMQNGQVRITGLSVKDQDLSIAADIAGPVPELLTLLKHPRLHLLSDHPIPVQRPAGALTGNLAITLPLEHDLVFEQVGIHAKGRLAGLRLGGVVAGRDLERGEVSFDVTQDGLHAGGPATVAGFASDVTVDMDFTHGGPAQVTQHATVAGRATKAQLASGGLDPGAFMPSGAVSIVGDYTEHQSGQASVVVRADLRDAVLAGAGWKKAAGAPGRASGRLSLLHGRLAGIDELRAEAPGLRVDGRAELAGGEPSRLVLNPIEIGPTRAHGEIRLATPGVPMRLNLAGPVLDLSSLFGPRAPSPANGGKSTPFVADLAFEKVLLARGGAFTDVRAHAEHDGTRLRSLQMQAAGPGRLQAEISPVTGGRRVLLRAQDAGALLSALDITGTIVGGSLAIDARYDDQKPGSPMSGLADLSEFHVQDAPAVGKLLQAVSLFGLPEALDGPGLKLNRARAPFSWADNDLYLGESEIYSASLGLTAKGHLDLGRHTLDVTGTVVPLYAINSALGRMPVIGRLFSPERGGGLFSLSYGLHGPMADPSVAVNPFSILTPGLARRLFRLFD